MSEEMQINYDPTVDFKEANFNFRKQKDEETGEETKRPTVTLNLPVPSVEGVANIFRAGGKQLELLMEAVTDVVVSRAREILNENSNIVKSEQFPYAELTWEQIANLPKAERRGGGIPKELWDDFVSDYISIMPSLTGKDEQRVKNAAAHLKNKFAQIKTQKKMLSALTDQLAIYINGSPNAEQYLDCVNFLTSKADKLMNVTEEDMLAAL